MPRWIDDNVLVGFDTADDAGVYKLTPELALVQTLDFFTPIVDDPYTYGAIAAANSLSDVYAMGGRPISALTVLAWPANGDPRDLEEILKGGAEKMHEAGCTILGGHSVADDEIKFGYAVTGAIDPGRVLANGGAKAGDVLYLTKPLGTGIIGTAIKFERADPKMMEQAIASMRALNQAAAEAIQNMPPGTIRACTDVTGFGLAGHGTEMARASGVTLELSLDALPVFDGVLEVAAENRSGGMTSNEAHFGPGVRSGVGSHHIIYDPQTSGGLLVAVEQTAQQAMDQAFRNAGVTAWRIGRAVAAVPGIHIHMIHMA